MNYFSRNLLLHRLCFFLSFALVASVFFFAKTEAFGAGNLDKGFTAPPDDAKPRVYWFWIYNRVDKAGITRDLEQFKAKGISGVNLICNGGYGGLTPLPGVKYQSPEWWDIFRHAVSEAKRLNIELGFNFSASCWVNRVIGELNKPKEERLTKTHDAFRFDMLTKDTSPIESGLLGPVTLLRDER